MEISHDSGLFARFSEPVAKRIQQLAADSLFLLKQGILLSEQGFLSPEQGIPTLLSFQSLDFIAAARFDLRAASRREFVPAYDRNRLGLTASQQRTYLPVYRLIPIS